MGWSVRCHVGRRGRRGSVRCCTPDPTSRGGGGGGSAREVELGTTGCGSSSSSSSRPLARSTVDGVRVRAPQRESWGRQRVAHGTSGAALGSQRVTRFRVWGSWGCGARRRRRHCCWVRAGRGGGARRASRIHSSGQRQYGGVGGWLAGAAARGARGGDHAVTHTQHTQHTHGPLCGGALAVPSLIEIGMPAFLRHVCCMLTLLLQCDHSGSLVSSRFALRKRIPHEC